MKRVLVTGASGFIGRHSLAHLAARDFEIHAVAHRQQLQQFKGIVWHRADLLDPNSVGDLMAAVAPTHLLHFGWYAEPGRYQHAEDNLRWCEAGIELLRVFAATGGQRAVFAGSCFEYDFSYGYCSEDLTPCVPATRYGAAKLALSQLVTRFPPAGISTAWGRIFHLYGPFERPGRLVSSVIRSLLKGERAKCTHGRQVRDFLQVDDVASAFVCLLDSEFAGIMNIGSGSPVPLRAIVSTIAACLSAQDRIDFGALPAPDNDPPLLVPDVRRLRDELGWLPRFSLHDGLADAIDWWRTRFARDAA